ncbi:hypothetical protein BESB_081680 [Besnoitia besnoiti]|uniref:SRS domain-containing protein n=1 Tax=Besnoitia besnoiti TaxID=94643 RepID=A0A2A9M4U2_BESBE|nr:hypothetical protein BESB_081680 [Besnoitia besnoiti]PFH32969.1 hypothetical protein BESB_081680 [Besnoitia besnoiti]
MKLNLASVGVAAVLAFSAREAAAIRQATSQHPVADPPQEEKIQTCSGKPLKLSISETNGSAAFICPSALSLLDPTYTQDTKDQLVHFGNETKKLTEVLPKAKLEKAAVSASSPSQPASRTPSGGGDQQTLGDVYKLTVSELPAQETAVRFKCTAAGKKAEEEHAQQKSASSQEVTSPTQTECEVTVTVASSAGASAAFRPAHLATVVASIAAMSGYRHFCA